MQATPAPTAMQVDTPPATPTDIASAVRVAREELAGVIRSLTEVLSTVAEGDAPPTEKAANGQQLSEEVNKEREEEVKKRDEALKKRRSLAPVLARFDALRKAVDAAVGLQTQRVEKAEKEEKEMSPEERQLLVERRAQLVEEVRSKNEKIKILIDHLRELHRDIVALRAGYIKPLTSQGRKS